MFNILDGNYIQLTRGDTARLTVTITNDNGEAYEIQNGDKLTLTLKKTVKDAEPVMTKTITGTDIFHIEPSDTSGLSFAKYKYDVELTTFDGDVYTVIPPSTFEILEEVTSR